MAQSRHHYERAFERHLVDSGRSFVSVNEVRRSILPPGHRLELVGHRAGEPARESLKSFDFMLYTDQGGLLIDIKGRKYSTGAAHRARARAINGEPAVSATPEATPEATTASSPGPAPGTTPQTTPAAAPAALPADPPVTVATTSARGTPGDPGPGVGRLESWVTIDDLESLGRWRQLFGPGYRACFVFVYWCDAVPPLGVFPELIGHDGRWYGVRGIELDDYVGAMRVRSARWRTVHLGREDFLRLSGPVLAERSAAGVLDGAGAGDQTPANGTGAAASSASERTGGGGQPPGREPAPIIVPGRRRGGTRDLPTPA